MCPRGRPRGQGRPRGLHLWRAQSRYFSNTPRIQLNPFIFMTKQKSPEQIILE